MSPPPPRLILYCSWFSTDLDEAAGSIHGLQNKNDVPNRELLVHHDWEDMQKLGIFVAQASYMFRFAHGNVCATDLIRQLVREFDHVLLEI